MSRLFRTLIAVAVLSAGSDARSDVPRSADSPPMAAAHVGKWRVEFTNGVTEVCAIGESGETSVVEPLRRSEGRSRIEAGSLVLSFNDDRVERWTPVGARYIVEHWYPASRFGSAAPVLGIADRGR